LQPRREVRGLADDVVFASAAAIDQTADDDQAGRDADPDLHRLSGRFEARHRVDDGERGAQRPLGRFLVRAGVAEIDKDAVADVSRNEAVERVYDGSNGL
jgi:hypothetical protein